MPVPMNGIYNSTAFTGTPGNWADDFTGAGSTFPRPYHNPALQDVYPMGTNSGPPAPHVPGGGAQGFVPGICQHRSAPRPRGLQSPPPTPHLVPVSFVEQLGSFAPSLPYNAPNAYDPAAPTDYYAGVQELAQFPTNGNYQLGEAFLGAGAFGPVATYTQHFVPNHAVHASLGATHLAPGLGSGTVASAQARRRWMPAPAEPASPKHVCGFPSSKGECDSSFALIKDLTRHRRSRHPQEGDPSYWCRCGLGGVRKDNHIRHVDSCGKPLCYPKYACICGRRCPDKDEHLAHVRDCQHGFGSRGRPIAS